MACEGCERRRKAIKQLIKRYGAKAERMIRRGKYPSHKNDDLKDLLKKATKK